MGDHCWIGSQTHILMGAEIGEGSVIGANSVVTKNVDAYCIVAGSPARIIRSRNVKHVLGH